MEQLGEDFIARQEENNHIISEIMQTRNDVEIKEVKLDYVWQLSSTNIKLKDIQGVIFGALSSRFWSFRKQLNLIDMSHHMEEIKK